MKLLVAVLSLAVACGSTSKERSGADDIRCASVTDDFDGGGSDVILVRSDSGRGCITGLVPRVAGDIRVVTNVGDQPISLVANELDSVAGHLGSALKNRFSERIDVAAHASRVVIHLDNGWRTLRSERGRLY